MIDAAGVTVPAELLEPGTDHRFEVLAVADNANRTIHEGNVLSHQMASPIRILGATATEADSGLRGPGTPAVVVERPHTHPESAA